MLAQEHHLTKSQSSKNKVTPTKSFLNKFYITPVNQLELVSQRVKDNFLLLLGGATND